MPAKIAEGTSQGQTPHDRSLQTSTGQQPRTGPTGETSDVGASRGNRQDHQSEPIDARTVVKRLKLNNLRIFPFIFILRTFAIKTFLLPRGSLIDFLSHHFLHFSPSAVSN